MRSQVGVARTKGQQTSNLPLSTWPACTGGGGGRGGAGRWRRWLAGRGASAASCFIAARLLVALALQPRARLPLCQLSNGSPLLPVQRAPAQMAWPAPPLTLPLGERLVVWLAGQLAGVGAGGESPALRRPTPLQHPPGPRLGRLCAATAFWCAGPAHGHGEVGGQVWGPGRGAARQHEGVFAGKQGTRGSGGVADAALGCHPPRPPLSSSPLLSSSTRQITRRLRMTAEQEVNSPARAGEEGEARRGAKRPGTRRRGTAIGGWAEA